MSIRDVPGFDASSVGSGDSYSSRRRPETSRDVVANRVGVTSTLFGVAMGLSWLLGRRRD